MIGTGTQIGATISRPNTALMNGVFSVNLDFGATAFNNPNAVFIEIGVRPNASANAYTILGPRQQLTVVPFAVTATNATNATAATSVNMANESLRGCRVSLGRATGIDNEGIDADLTRAYGNGSVAASPNGKP